MAQQNRSSGYGGYGEFAIDVIYQKISRQCSISREKNGQYNKTNRFSYLLLFAGFVFLFLLGFYMSIQTSSPRSHGDEAKLLFSPPGSEVRKLSCLKFYYHMNGAAINRQLEMPTMEAT